MSRELTLAEIFQLGYYWETKILLTAVRLDVFSSLDSAERTAAAVAKRIGADERALTLLLNALVAIGVVHKSGDQYENSEVARTSLVRTAPGYVGHLLVLHDAEWNNWGRLEDAIRTGRSPATRHLFETDPELGASVLAVLHRIGKQTGPDLARRVALQDARTLLDLGGGAGTNAIAFCQAYPELRVTVFDLPQTLKTAERTIKDAHLEARIDLIAGDFNRDGLGGPYDAVLMSDILHYQGPEENAALVRRCFSHLHPGGRLIVKDRFLDASETSPAWVAAFAVHIFVNTERGRCYRVSDAADWLRQAGFQSVDEVEQTSVVQGTKPEG